LHFLPREALVEQTASKKVFQNHKILREGKFILKNNNFKHFGIIRFNKIKGSLFKQQHFESGLSLIIRTRTLLKASSIVLF